MLQRLTSPPKHDAAEQRELEDSEAAPEIRNYLELADTALGRKSRPVLVKPGPDDQVDTSLPKKAA